MVRVRRISPCLSKYSSLRLSLAFSVVLRSKSQSTGSSTSAPMRMTGGPSRSKTLREESGRDPGLLLLHLGDEECGFVAGLRSMLETG